MPGLSLVTKSALTRLALLFSFLTVLAILFAAGLPATSRAAAGSGIEGSKNPSSREFVPGDVIVKYRSESHAKVQTRAATLFAQGRQVPIEIRRFEGADLVPGLRLGRVNPDDTLAAIEALRHQPDVVYAEPNYLLYPTLTPNDPRFVSNEMYGLTKIGAPQAWNTTTGNGSIVVGVIDEGIDVTHPDLIANIWTNPGEVAGNGIDDDHNGFIDDVHGYDFSSNSGSIPGDFHATHVAGIVGAVGNNGVGVVGVNWNVKLMSLKFIDGPNGDTADAIRACSYAKQMRELWISSNGALGANLRVLNNSYGGGQFEQSFSDAISALNNAGILFVAAAGNTSNAPAQDNDVIPFYPSCYPSANVISVAATDSNDALGSFSHFGLGTVQIGAPGVNILSTTPSDTYSFVSGTSMASPHVAGAAALLLAANPNLTVQRLKSLLIFNGDQVPALDGKTLTGRRLNVGNSFQAIAENDVTIPGTASNFHLNSQNGRSMNVGWTASGDDGATGQASLYTVTFTDATTNAVIFLKSVVPVASGATQSIDIKLPYRHINGTLTLREFDNVGNEGVAATLAVSVTPSVGDPYLTSVGTATPLSSGGTALGLIADDGLKSDYALPFTFPYFGETFSKVTISTNGNLYFSTPPTRPNGDANDVPSSSFGITQFKMISGLWDDLRTDRRAGDDVYVVTPDASRIIFRWQGVTFGNGTPSTEFPVNFEIELRSNGTILTRYGAGQSAPTNTNLFPVVGISGGEPEAYVISTHTSEQSPTNLTNAAEVTFLPRTIGINNTVQFSASPFQVSESDPAVTVSVTRVGDTSTQSSVDYVTQDGSATQKGDYIFASGHLTFAAGETTKTFSVLLVDDSFDEPDESFSVVLTNPSNTVIGAINVAQVLIAGNDHAQPTTNPLDNSDARFFVRQHYLDFLNREPDAPGLAFWTNEITSCGNNATCIEVKRINVSAAFFLSIEFQETGYLVYRMYKAAYGDLPGAPVPIRYEEFLPDSQDIARGVIVNVGDWQGQLESNKQAFALNFVSRPRFTTAYPTSMSPTEFVTALYNHAGATPSADEKQLVINQFGPEALSTADLPARARALRLVADNASLRNQELNRAFVLMEYFGYLRRNPYDPPEVGLDYSGFNFWLTKLNQFNGDAIAAEMVKAFISSTEYRQRFGP